MKKPSGNRLFHLRDEYGRGRCVMLSDAIISSIISWLTTDIFYTSFLMIYGISLVNIGIITFIPYIACCVGIFSPSLLERFQKRKALLVGGKLLAHTLSVLGITLVPVLVQDPGARTACLVTVILLANLINALMGGGFSVWHLNFIPDEIRADYLLKQTTISSFIGIGISLLSAVVADMLSASPYANTIIISFRYIAYALGLLDVVLLALPKEYPYARTHSTPRLRDIITMPLSSKPFMLTMLAVFLHTFFSNVPASFVNYYLLNDVGLQYTFVYGINMLYPLILLVLQPVARRLINRYGWLRVLSVSLLIHAPTWAAYACVTAGNYVWLYPTMRIAQHIIGVGLNISYANIVYLNLPPSDQTNYFSFSQLTTSLSAFLGQMTGTALIALIGESAWMLFGMSFSSVQTLLLIQALGNVVVPLFIIAHFKVLDPHTREMLAASGSKN